MWLPASLLAAAVLAGLSVSPRGSPDDGLLVSAAISLSEVLQECGGAFTRETGIDVALNFGASNALARQIANGAPADVFISADARQMAVAERAGAIAPGTRVDVASNRLAVVVAARLAERWADATPLADARVRRIALGDPEAVPAGVYAKAWLRRLDLWERVKPKLVPSSTVRAALAAVISGAADAAVVYRTDALASPRVHVAFEVAREDAPPIVYPAAVTRHSRHPDQARRFVDFLRGAAAVRLFAARGFTAPGQ